MEFHRMFTTESRQPRESWDVIVGQPYLVPCTQHTTQTVSQLAAKPPNTCLQSGHSYHLQNTMLFSLLFKTK